MKEAEISTKLHKNTTSQNFIEGQKNTERRNRLREKILNAIVEDSISEQVTAFTATSST